MDNPKKNHEGYSDPTAFQAIRNVDKEQKKRERPYKPNGRKHQYRVRLNDSEKHMLELLSEEYDLPVSEVIRTCVKSKYHEIINQHEYMNIQ